MGENTIADSNDNEDATCAICMVSLEELGGALALPCNCRIGFCERCWDRSLAGNMPKGGVPTCPTCRSSIRVDYDARVGRIVYSKVAEARLRYSETWISDLTELLQSHDLTLNDEGDKFAVVVHRGERIQARDLIRQVQHEAPPGSEEALRIENLRSRLPAFFPLTLTFKEYALTIDNTIDGVLPDLEPFFAVTEGRICINGSSDLSLVGRWKDQTSGVQLHPDDRIIAVNDLSEIPEIREELRKPIVLKIKVQQSDCILRCDLFDSNNPTRKRLTEQTKTRQHELLRQYATQHGSLTTSPLTCVCGGVLEHLDLRTRASRLVDATGYMRHHGRAFSVDDLIKMKAITCDLCHESVEEGSNVWTCETGEKTILHSQTQDICDACFNRYSGSV